MNDITKEIALLFPQGKSITLKGKSYVIKPFGFGKFPKVLRLLNSIVVTDKQEKEVAYAAASGKINQMSLSELVLENAEVVMELCMMAINEKREFFDDLPGDEGLSLAQAIVEVNLDFFTVRLQPKLLTAVSELVASVGGVSSQGSSQPATA